MVDALACGDDGLPAKPAGEQIWTICQQLGVEPRNTIMVGDTSTDMLLGKNAGCGLSIGDAGRRVVDRRLGRRRRRARALHRPGHQGTIPVRPAGQALW
ncbi:hypothetical protein ON010_g16263 [Phytophthora cinnamomi]|nr:hypothetical protein ON010_g16263 [Phytophthora cinnamomi]